MFSSIASFIFGSNTSATANREANPNPRTPRQTRTAPDQRRGVRIDADNTIVVNSSTPSVTGNNNVSRQAKRGKNKRNRNNQRNNQRQGEPRRTSTPTPTITKLLTPNESLEEDFDESDWCIVGKDDEEVSLPRTDSEEESLVEAAPRPDPTAPVRSVPQQQRRRQHNNSHSVYSGPRPHQQRNFSQRSHNNSGRSGASISGISLNVSTLSPRRSISGAVGGEAADAATNAAVAAALADASITQAIYVPSVPSYRDVAVAGAAVEAATVEAAAPHDNNVDCSCGAVCLMNEPWFVTPPPCFISTGPIQMETSPFENLLIEHPSMSVYHSIRSAQEATVSFDNLDLGMQESQLERGNVTAALAEAAADIEDGRTQAIQQRSAGGARLDRYSAAQVKQELLARSSQKYHDKKERQNLCRGALKRANKVRDFQAKGNRRRRSDMQHCKIVSGANNNRKCCY